VAAESIRCGGRCRLPRLPSQESSCDADGEHKKMGKMACPLHCEGVVFVQEM
jgi:hypothetical protein